MDLKNRIVLITGAGTGIGKATALELARCGSTIVIVDINEKNATETLDEAKKYSLNSIMELCDVSDQLQVKQMIQKVHQHFGRIDILINNAAHVMIVKLFDKLTDDEFKKQMDVNLYGTVYCTHAVIPIMLQQGRGVIMNFSSPMAKTIVPAELPPI